MPKKWISVDGSTPALAALLYKNSPAPDRWPLNQNSVMFGNWGFAVLFYLPPIFFPNIIILGLMPMLFGAIGQTLSHTLLNNAKLKAAGLRYGYNSGMVTAFLGHLPLAIAYGYVVQRDGLATGRDWLVAFLYAVFAYVVVFRLGIMKGLEDKNSPHPFDETELRRFDKLYRH